jgi:hypothetical protein
MKSNIPYTPKFFKAWELVPSLVYTIMEDDALILLKPSILMTADDLRKFFGAPVTVNTYFEGPGEQQFRGFRPAYCPLGADASEHRLGGAIDCDIRGVTAEEARQSILKHRDRFPYLRRMEAGVDWLHCDVKETGRDGIILFNA